MAVTQSEFGITQTGEACTLYTITNASGNSVSVMDYGAAIQSILLKDKNGETVDVALGYDTVTPYEHDGCCFGAVCGRVANRIANAGFELNGSHYQLDDNDGPNCLHGGFHGFHRCMFSAQIKSEDNTVVFTRISEDGEGGFPGTLNVGVAYIFDDFDRLIIDYWAQSDAETPVNLTNHTYFNLNGHDSGNIFDHQLQIFGGSYTPIADFSIPTGEIVSVKGTPLDFIEPARLGPAITSKDPIITAVNGIDHNFCVPGDAMKNMAILYSEKSGIRMYCCSDMPGVQVYTGNFIGDRMAKGGASYHNFQGIALETQFYPDSVNKPMFPNTILKPGEMYHHTTTYEFENDAELAALENVE